MNESPGLPPTAGSRWRWLLSPWMLLVVMALCLLTWVGVQVQRRRAETEALALLKSVDDGRSFNLQLSNPFRPDDAPEHEMMFTGGPDWSTKLLGVDLFRTVSFFQAFAPGNSFSYGSDDTGKLIISRSYQSGIAGDETQLLSAFANLTGLHLEAHPVGDEIGPVLKQLPKLESLNLSNTAISDAILPDIATLSRLASLDISRTDVTDKGMQHLQRMSTLELLNVEMTNVSDKQIEQLRKRLPHCEVLH